MGDCDGAPWGYARLDGLADVYRPDLPRRVDRGYAGGGAGEGGEGYSGTGDQEFFISGDCQ